MQRAGSDVWISTADDVSEEATIQRDTRPVAVRSKSSRKRDRLAKRKGLARAAQGEVRTDNPVDDERVLENAFNAT
jgi:hypothetical protein